MVPLGVRWNASATSSERELVLSFLHSEETGASPRQEEEKEEEEGEGCRLVQATRVLCKTRNNDSNWYQSKERQQARRCEEYEEQETVESRNEVTDEIFEGETWP